MMRGLIGKSVFVFFLVVPAASGAAAQSRIALIIGNSAYRSAPPLASAVYDAAIVAETMRAAGYDVSEVRDVRLADVGQTMRGFLDKVAAAGPEAVAFVYFAGYGAQ